MREAAAVVLPACALGMFLLPRPIRPNRAAVTAITLAAGLGIGAASLTTTALLAAGISLTSVTFVAADLVIWVLLGALGWRYRHGERPALPVSRSGRNPLQDRDTPTPPPRSVIPVIVFVSAALMAAVSVWGAVRAMPHGEWDAWAIWNQHARFLFRGGADAWRGFLTIDWAQPDYPLLLPAAVARLWAYAGGETLAAPALIAVVFGASCIALVVAALGGQRGWIAGLLTLGAASFLLQIPTQQADIPLAFYMLASLIVVADTATRSTLGDRWTAAATAGALGAMAAWTKNEGVTFVLLLLSAALVMAVRSRGSWPLMAIAGAAPALLAVAWFKLAVAPPSRLFEGPVVLDRLLDPDRHSMVARMMSDHVMRWSASAGVPIFAMTAVAAAVAASRGGVPARTQGAVLGLLFLSYYVVYVMTPFDIAWHVSTSFDRLLAQLWPAVVVTAFMRRSGGAAAATGATTA